MPSSSYKHFTQKDIDEFILDLNSAQNSLGGKDIKDFVDDEQKTASVRLKENKPEENPQNSSACAEQTERKRFVLSHTNTNADIHIDSNTLEEENSSSTTNYPGDTKSIGDEYKPLKDDKWQNLAEIFPTSFDIACFHKSIADGQESLHLWQVEENESLSKTKATSKNAHKYALCAANGSGKDIFVIAPFAIWFALCKTRSLILITSASGTQLTAQTENYIRSLAEKINAFFGQPIFKIKQRFIFCNLSGSEIRLFATDEAGKAEGYHPLEPGAEMCIIENEAKSIKPEINLALRRCTGYNFWLKISTPGEPNGHFHYAFTTWKHTRRITYYDCPHLSPQDFEDDKVELGEHSALFRSKWLAEFTSIEGQVVITEENFTRCKDSGIGIMFQDWPLRVGIDYSVGRDETVVIGTKGNCIKFMETFRETDGTLVADKIEFILRKHNAEKTSEYLFGDDGGVGNVITAILQRKGWNIKRILNQSAAVYKREFGNRGAEMWFRVARFFQERVWHITRHFFDKDSLLIKQLTNRYYKKQETQGRTFLQSKKDAKADGRPSPDRADALILSLTGLTIKDFLVEEKKLETNKTKYLNSEELIEHFQQRSFHNINEYMNKKPQKNIHSSVSVLMNN